MKIFLKIALIIIILGSLLGTKIYFIGPGNIISWQDPKPDYMPPLAGENLLGEKLSFPKDLKGPLTLLVIGFKREHQKLINTWIEAYEKGKVNKGGVDFFELPIIYEVGMLKRLFINNGMKMGIPDPEQLKRTVTVYMDRQKLFDSLKMEVNSIYSLLIQQDGKIVWRSQGVVSSEKLDALNHVIQSYQLNAR